MMMMTYNNFILVKAVIKIKPVVSHMSSLWSIDHRFTREKKLVKPVWSIDQRLNKALIINNTFNYIIV